MEEKFDLLEDLENAPLPAQPDDLIWQVLNDQFCSFKVKTRAPETNALCRNEYNLTGLCNRSSCPLANTDYATVRDDGEKISLFVKRPECQHEPRKIWERILLSDSKTEKSKQMILTRLEGQSPFVRDKCIARYERLVEIKAKERQLAKHSDRAPVVEVIKSKQERKERSREMRALTVSRLEQAIEGELLKRLQSGVYGDMYNLKQKEFEAALEEGTKKMEFVEDDEEEEEEEVEYEYDIEDEEELDIEEIAVARKRKPVVEIEYEDEGSFKKIIKN
jgi:protein MAK16